MHNHFKLLFVYLWGQFHTPNFKPIEFDRFKEKSVYDALPRHCNQSIDTKM